MSEFCAGNCARCPMVIDVLESIETQRGLKDRIVDSAMSDEFDEVVPNLFEMAKEGFGLLEGAQELATPEELATRLRKNAGEAVENLGEKIERDEESLQKAVMGCIGPLAMRATKAGVEVTVRICMNPLINESNSTIELADVQRRMVADE